MRMFTLALVATLPVAAAAQNPERPATWKVRPDNPAADTSGLSLVTMPPGWHITTGGTSLILWDPAWTAAGRFRLESTIFFFRQQSRDTEGYGLLFGGSDLDGPRVSYLYFLLRNDGRFTVRHRAGTEVHTITDWTAHDAIARLTAGEGDVRNVLTVVAAADSVRFSVNGQPVAAYSRGHMNPDGAVGLRVNHGLNLHVAKLEIEAGR